MKLGKVVLCCPLCCSIPVWSVSAPWLGWKSWMWWEHKWHLSSGCASYQGSSWEWRRRGWARTGVPWGSCAVITLWWAGGRVSLQVLKAESLRAELPSQLGSARFKCALSPSSHWHPHSRAARGAVPGTWWGLGYSLWGSGCRQGSGCDLRQWEQWLPLPCSGAASCLSRLGVSQLRSSS